MGKSKTLLEQMCLLRSDQMKEKSANCQIKAGFFPYYEKDYEYHPNVDRAFVQMVVNDLYQSTGIDYANDDIVLECIGKMCMFISNPFSDINGVIVCSSPEKNRLVHDRGSQGWGEIVYSVSRCYRKAVSPSVKTSSDIHWQVNGGKRELDGGTPLIWQKADGKSYIDPFRNVYSDGLIDWRNRENQAPRVDTGNTEPSSDREWQFRLFEPAFFSFGKEVCEIGVYDAPCIKVQAEFTDGSRPDFKHVIVINDLKKDDDAAMKVLKKRTELGFVTFVTTNQIDSIPENIRSKYIVSELKADEHKK